MDSTTEKSAPSRAMVERTIVGRVAVLGVTFAGAIALASAAIAAGFPAAGPAFAAALVAAVGGGVWWYAPRAGYWILLTGGLLTMTVSGVALVRGAVPSALVAFWGGSAVLLAAILHLTGGADRSGTVTLAAVISLLVLSALGLGQYVRTTWSDNERAILRRLPQLIGTPVSTWTDPVSPAPGGAWACAWMTTAPPSETLRRARVALVRDGWRVEYVSANSLSAEKQGEELDLNVSPPSAESASPSEAASGATVVMAVARESDSPDAP